MQVNYSLLEVNMKLIIITILFIMLIGDSYSDEDSVTSENSMEQRKAEMAENLGSHSLDMAIDASSKGDESAKQAFLVKAETEFSLAISYAPDKPELYYDRATARYELSNYVGAIEDLDKYLTLVPNDRQAILIRGLSKSVTTPEDTTGACYDFKKAEKLGQDLKSMAGIDQYCKGQEGW